MQIPIPFIFAANQLQRHYYCFLGSNFKLIMRHFNWVQTLVLVILFASCDTRESKLQKFLLKGNMELNAGHPQQAEAYYLEALKIDPCFVDALNNLGTLEFNRRYFDKAISRYDEAVDCHPEFLPAYFNRANALYETKEYYGALADLDRIEKARPDTASVYFLRGLIFTKMRKYPEAVVAFDEALSKDSTATVDLIVNKATVKYYMGLLDEAEGELQSVMKRAATEPNVFNTLAMIYADKKQYDLAMQHVNKALELKPGDAYFLNNRGFIYLETGRLTEAETDINQSLSADPYNPWAYRNKGIFYLQKGDLASAERLLAQALQMDSFIDKIHYYLGSVFLKGGKVDLACEQFKLSKESGERVELPKVTCR